MEVQHNALLATVQICEHEAALCPPFAPKEWPLLAAWITFGWFDLDDLSPEVGEDARTELLRAAGEVENTYVTKSVGHRCVPQDMR